MPKRVQEVLRTHLLPRRHTTLLVAIVVSFAVRPLIGDSGLAEIAFSLSFLVVLLVALYAIQVDELLGERETRRVQRRKRSHVGWILAVPAIVVRLVMMSVPNSQLILLGSIDGGSKAPTKEPSRSRESWHRTRTRIMMARAQIRRTGLKENAR